MSDLSGDYCLIFLNFDCIDWRSICTWLSHIFACRVDSHHLQENVQPIFAPESALSMTNILEAQRVFEYTDSWLPVILCYLIFNLQGPLMLSKHGELG